MRHQKNSFDVKIDITNLKKLILLYFNSQKYEFLSTKP